MKLVISIQQQLLFAEWIHTVREDQVGDALEGGVRYHLEGLDFRVALVLGGLGLVASSGPASTCCAAVACSKIAVTDSSGTQAPVAHRRPSDSMVNISTATNSALSYNSWPKHWPKNCPWVNIFAV